MDNPALARIREAAWQPSDSENAWGLVYPDLTRTFAPLVVPELLDRGWAMEQAWRRHMREPDATLNSWRLDVVAGWRPATAFGVTVVETGGRHLFATYDASRASTRQWMSRRSDARLRCADRHGRPADGDVSDVAPVARAQVDAPAYHLSDGGIWDNLGLTAALESAQQHMPHWRTRRICLAAKSC